MGVQALHDGERRGSDALRGVRDVALRYGESVGAVAPAAPGLVGAIRCTLLQKRSQNDTYTHIASATAYATWARRGHAPTPPRTFSPGQTPTGWPPRTLPSATDPGVGRRGAGDWARSSADQSWSCRASADSGGGVLRCDRRRPTTAANSSRCGLRREAQPSARLRPAESRLLRRRRRRTERVERPSAGSWLVGSIALRTRPWAEGRRLDFCLSAAATQALPRWIGLVERRALVRLIRHAYRRHHSLPQTASATAPRRRSQQRMPTARLSFMRGRSSPSGIGLATSSSRRRRARRQARVVGDRNLADRRALRRRCSGWASARGQSRLVEARGCATAARFHGRLRAG